ncbi:hypothetical protein DRF67_13630 [Chryseobacterium pennipullorum]|uniref:Uncharacterized protein n=1 Tax=Chryseobacterium pennipullorum TaxID=2258963 RepID=A0A3D9AZ30_9FLAO|nr:hypothetical protein DRF67_13630 [Chryseobacterium pennipullorum]
MGIDNLCRGRRSNSGKWSLGYVNGFALSVHYFLPQMAENPFEHLSDRLAYKKYTWFLKIFDFSLMSL